MLLSNRRSVALAVFSIIFGRQFVYPCLARLTRRPSFAQQRAITKTYCALTELDCVVFVFRAIEDNLDSWFYFFAVFVCLLWVVLFTLRLRRRSAATSADKWRRIDRFLDLVRLR